MVTHRSVVISRDKLDFEVSGEFESYSPGSSYTRTGDPGDPPEGGVFVDDVYVSLNGIEISEYLSQSFLEELIVEAEVRLSSDPSLDEIAPDPRNQTLLVNLIIERGLISEVNVYHNSQPIEIYLEDRDIREEHGFKHELIYSKISEGKK
jgi:hypothetical protein